MVQDFDLDCDFYVNLNNPRAQERVVQLKFENNLVDPWRVLNPDSKRFTWRRTNPFKQARLDFFLVSNSLLNFIKWVDILPGYRTDHSIIILDICFNNFKKGRGFWKFNNFLLQNQDYVKLVNKVIDDCILQYAAMPYTYRSVHIISIQDLSIVIEDDTFFETLLLLIRGETIKFSANLKRNNRCWQGRAVG